MPKTGKIEDRLEALRQLRRATASADVVAHLKEAFNDRSNLVIAEAAKIAGQLRETQLVPELLAAFARLFENPVKTDAKCWGKTAIVKALTLLDHSEAAPFLRAAAHVQMEPVYGGQEDAAIHLRASAVLALVQCTDLTRSEILRHLVNAMADTSDTVRIEAVRALEQMDGEESALLLRLKAHSGDKRPPVMGQVFDSLLALEREHAVEFVAGFLKAANAEIRDEAALSLGASRLPGAVKALIEAWQSARGDFASALLRALSSSREDSAFAFLLKLVAEGSPRQSSAALEALGLHSDSPELQDRIERAKAERSAAGL